MNLMKAPKERDLVADQMLKPNDKIKNQQRKRDFDPEGPIQIIKEPPVFGVGIKSCTHR